MEKSRKQQIKDDTAILPIKKTPMALVVNGTVIYIDGPDKVALVMGLLELRNSKFSEISRVATLLRTQINEAREQEPTERTKTIREVVDRITLTPRAPRAKTNKTKGVE
ncbi:MAG: hypothetical protein GY938_13150 [Ketobacter sp.]|nr:hypothetical protein [Ketobacter sp.]